MKQTWRGIAKVAGGAVVALAVTGMAAHHLMPHRHQPEKTEFGLGPRRSASGLYSATIQIDQPLSVGPITAIRLAVQDAGGRAVDGATITVGGGMPAHRHGLPTKPRVTRTLGDGVYQVDGVKFSMGGWWVLQFDIDGSAGQDSVSFNLEL